MTDYNPPDDTEIATSKAIKATTGRRLRDMSIAITEGATGAPRVQGVALGGRLAGIYSKAANSWQTFTDYPGCNAITITASLENTANGAVEIAFSTDGGSSWGSGITIGGAISGDYSTTVVVGFEEGKAVSVGSDGTYYGVHTFTPRTNSTDAFRLRNTGGAWDFSVMIESGFE